MAIKTFTTGEVLTASDTNTYLANSGLVYVAGGALSTAATDFIGCFTSEYTNYRVVIDSISLSGSADIYFQLLSGTTPAVGADYSWAYTGLTTTNLSRNSSSTGQTFTYTGMTAIGVNTLVVGGISFDIYNPQLATRTIATCTSAGYDSNFFTRSGIMQHNVLAAYNGFRLSTQNTPTMAGTVRIYGYRKA